MMLKKYSIFKFQENIKKRFPKKEPPLELRLRTPFELIERPRAEFPFISQRVELILWLKSSITQFGAVAPIFCIPQRQKIRQTMARRSRNGSQEEAHTKIGKAGTGQK